MFRKNISGVSSASSPSHRATLAWRLLLPVPLTVVVAVGLIWLSVPRLLNSMAVNDAVLNGQQVAAQFKAIRAYYTQNIVGKVVADGNFKASFDHKSNPRAIPLPATLLHDLSASLAGSDTSFALYSKYPFPIFKDRKLDDFQQQAWDFLTANPKDFLAHGNARRQADRPRRGRRYHGPGLHRLS